MNVPFLDLKAHNQALKDEILALWTEILDGAAFIGGKHVQGLEEEFAAACGAPTPSPSAAAPMRCASSCWRWV